MINQETIELIYDAAQITDVVGDFVSLKRRGVNYLGLCPFHNEKTPSFTVSAVKGIYKCFGCGKGGNSVNFIMEHENLGYHDALRYLAKKYHIEIIEKEATPEEIALKNERESLIIVSEFAGKFFHDCLETHSEGKAVGAAYFKERGIREDMINKFQLGYSPEKRDALTQAAIAAGYKTEYLVKAGLTIEKDNYRFDRFAGRVMFPIHSISGQLIAFTGRVLKLRENTGKYVNSPESDIYHKGRVLYGMFQAKKSIIQNDKCFLVEGNTDVISMHQSGIENVVASSGTSLTDDQIRLIKRFTNNLTIIYDNDKAGIKAAIRGIDMVLEQGLNVKVLLLPEGDDPDSYAQKHSSKEVLDYIAKNESDFVLFKTRLLMDEAKSDPIKKATLITDIVRSVAIIPENITRQVYIKECASLLKVDEGLLYSEVLKIRRTRFEQQHNVTLPVPRPDEKTKPAVQIPQRLYEFELQEREIVRLLLKYGNNILFQGSHENSKDQWIVTVAEFIINEIKHDEIELQQPFLKQIFDEYAMHYSQHSELAQAYFTRHPDREVNAMVADLLSERYKLDKKLFAKGANVFIETEEMKLEDIVPLILIDFKSKKVAALRKEVLLKLMEAQNTNDTEKIEELQMQIQSLDSIKKTFAANQGGRTILH
jgi:DNA primase